MKCHLVYAVPNAGSMFKKSQRKIRMLLQKKWIISTIGDRQSVCTSLWLKISPYSMMLLANY